MLNELAAIISFSFLGFLIGIATGLIPGFHTNNVAITLLSLPFLNDLKAAILISSAAITHTFLDIIPSTFIGAPEEDTALVILPAHSMLLKGLGYKAISISAKASMLSVIASFMLLLPFKFFIGSPINFYIIIQKAMPFILIAISVFVVATSRNIKNAFLIFMLAGLFGIVISHLPNSIFPALAGLFGASTIIMAKKEELPEQKIDESDENIEGLDIASGVLAGGVVAILPGVSSAIATTMALEARKGSNEENAIAILSAANTATNFFVIATLFVLLKARSGFAIAMQHFLSISKWNNTPPQPLLIILASLLLSSILSFYATKFIGKIIARNISRINYSILLILSLAIIIAMVTIFSGMIGLAIFIVATIIGINCLKMNVRRSNLMGVLLIPLILFYIRLYIHLF